MWRGRDLGGILTNTLPQKGSATKAQERTCSSWTECKGVWRMTRQPLATGLRHTAELVVSGRLTVPAVSSEFQVFRDMPAVFATAHMIAFVEAVCIEALKPYLSENQRTVDTHIDMSHCAPTPVGMTVTAEVHWIEVAGPRLTFAVECRDEVELIGRGYHKRAIIDVADFMTKAREKPKKG